MTGRARTCPPVAATPRGAVQLAAGAALVAAGVCGGWAAPLAAGASLLLAAVTGLVEVLLCRALASGKEERDAARPDGRTPALAALLPDPTAEEGSWARIDQHGAVIGHVGRPPVARGLYRRRSVTLAWHDAFGFWRARRVVPADREVCVPPAADGALVARVAGGLGRRSLDASPERDASGVRAYEKGDGLRQIAWRQSAHHGKLMSFDVAGSGAPAVLVVADTLDATDAEALAATAAALLRALRRTPDVLLTDGVSCWRTPARQERFLAALVADDGDAHGDARARARLVARLAATGGRGRRRVVVVGCDAHGGCAAELARSPLARTLLFVPASGGGSVAAAREAPAADGASEARAEPRRVRRDETRDGRPTRAHEGAAVLACLAVALLSLAPLLDMVQTGGWTAVAGTLLAGAAVAGGILGGLARTRSWDRRRRALATAGLVALVCVLGLLATDAAFAQWFGFGIAEATGRLGRAGTAEGADPAGALAAIVGLGVAQLGGQQPVAPVTMGGASACWDLAIMLAGTALAALVGALAVGRLSRCAVALVPLGLAAADQTVMGVVALPWAAVVCGLGLLLVWLADPRGRRVVRAAAVILLAGALAGTGAFAAGRCIPLLSGSGGATDPSAEAGAGTQVSTLVDLSRNLARRSTAQALAYSTDAGHPLYLRICALDAFDGDTWRADVPEGGLRTDGSALLAAGRDDGSALAEAPRITTVVSSATSPTPVPPGTATLDGMGDGTWRATGCYLAPLAAEADLDALPDLRRALARYDDATSADPRCLDVGGAVADNVLKVAAEARLAGADATGGGFDAQLTAVRWLVSYFTAGSFVYSTEAPGGDGQDNLAVLSDFLAERRGYCTHYATAFALLSRLLGVPSRVVIGYLPGDGAHAAGADGYEVTMQQLHAWSEVWLDGIGWVGVDVTPGAGEAGAAAAAQADGGPSDEGRPTTEPPSNPEPDAPSDGTGSPSPSDPGEKGAPAAAAPEPTPEAAPPAPDWLPTALLATAAAGAGATAAALVRVTRGRHLAVGDAELAWSLLCRAACRHGVRWPASATEDEVADAVCAALDPADPRSSELAADIRALARTVCLSRYAARAVPGDPALLARLATKGLPFSKP